MTKPLAEMTEQELAAEFASAQEAERAAEFIDGLSAWASARKAAVQRQEHVISEMARRRLAGAGGAHS